MKKQTLEEKLKQLKPITGSPDKDRIAELESENQLLKTKLAEAESKLRNKNP